MQVTSFVCTPVLPFCSGVHQKHRAQLCRLSCRKSALVRLRRCPSPPRFGRKLTWCRQEPIFAVLLESDAQSKQSPSQNVIPSESSNAKLVSDAIYEKIKKQYFETTCKFGAVAFLWSLVIYTPDTSFGVGLGVLASLAYIQLLILSTDRIGKVDWVRMQIGRLAAFSALMILVSQVPDVLNYWGVFAGFNVHKAGVVSNLLQGVFLSRDKEKDGIYL
mmetsp:Transcript_5526/g.8581  ORF Transcript_5526/g.8581 Transcript_5526/m.8581 type:complete len:218 (-) Transcript_5526:126-779(-)